MSPAGIHTGSLQSGDGNAKQSLQQSVRTSELRLTVWLVGVVWCGSRVGWGGVGWVVWGWCGGGVGWGVVWDWCAVEWGGVGFSGAEWRVYPVSAYGLLQWQAHHSPRSSGTRPPCEDHEPPT